jgi:hypothetical protein
MNADLRIELSLAPTDQGGRKTPLLPGEFRTVLAQSNKYHSARIVVPFAMAPGGPPVECEVAFLDPGYALQHFPKGATFEFWEGGVKGHGRVIEVHAR